mgnify:CR=1 FL=1
MEIGLIDVDSHNFPNLALMKISAFHKQNGDHVEFADSEKTYDRVYASKVFTESKEPKFPKAKEILRGGSGYDLVNHLPYEIEHMYPDYGLYPELTKDTAIGFLTRGCPRQNHGFCITPEKDGCKSVKVADISEFWNGQKNIILLDQNLLACKDRMDLLEQLAETKAMVEFNGGMDARLVNDDIVNALKKIRVKDYHFAWDDPRENLEMNFELMALSGMFNPKYVGVYVLTNYWSTIEEDLDRVMKLKRLGYSPYVMIYDKQKFVDSRGHWLPDVAERYTKEELRHFKICQHMQRWTTARNLFRSCETLDDYGNYRRWVDKGMKVPERRRKG